MAPIRVLQVIGMMGCGGAEAMLMNLYRHMDRDRVQFDFAVHTKEHQMYDDEILRMGGQIYHFPKFDGENIVAYCKAWNRFFSEHEEHRVVHGHNGSSAAIYLKIAKKYGRYAIAHSHSTKNTERKLREYLWRMCSYPTRYVADRFFACSMEAAVSRFGKRVANSERCRVLNNAIDTGRFSFSPEARAEIRAAYGLEDKFVVGHVGRHTPPKNPMFLLEVFAQIHQKNPSAWLLQVGTGELTEAMKTKCTELGITDVVIFTGVRTDVERFYSAMDVFLFPSQWEGLGNVVVEAQTSGLPCVVSDAVPSLADMKAGLFHSVSLSESAETWAKTAQKFGGGLNAWLMRLIIPVVLDLTLRIQRGNCKSSIAL